MYSVHWALTQLAISDHFSQSDQGECSMQKIWAEHWIYTCPWLWGGYCSCLCCCCCRIIVLNVPRAASWSSRWDDHMLCDGFPNLSQRTTCCILATCERMLQFWLWVHELSAELSQTVSNWIVVSGITETRRTRFGALLCGSTVGATLWRLYQLRGGTWGRCWRVTQLQS